MFLATIDDTESCDFSKLVLNHFEIGKIIRYALNLALRDYEPRPEQDYPSENDQNLEIFQPNLQMLNLIVKFLGRFFYSDDLSSVVYQQMPEVLKLILTILDLQIGEYVELKN